MTVSFIGFAKGDTPGSGTTLATSSGLSVLAGDLLVGTYKSETALATVGITDTAGNTYTVRPVLQHTTNADMFVYAFYTVATAGHASNIITATSSGATLYRSVVVNQYRTDVGVFSFVAQQNAQTRAALTQSVATCAAIALASNGVVAAFPVVYAGGITATPSAGFTTRYAGTPSYFVGSQDQIVGGGGGSPVAGVTWSSATADSLIAALGFVASAPVEPVAPSGVVAIVTSATSVSVTWSDNSSAETSQKVQYAYGPTFSTWLDAPLSPAATNDTVMSVTGLTSGQDVQIRVCATLSGTDSAFAYSNVVKPLALISGGGNLP